MDHVALCTVSAWNSSQRTQCQRCSFLECQMFQFFRKRNASHRDSAADLQFALLQDAERNIYGDTAMWTKKHSTPLANDRWRPKRSSVYSNIFEPEIQNKSHEFDTEFNSTDNSQATGRSLFPALDFCLYISPMWITRDRRFSCFNILGLCITFCVAAIYRFCSVPKWTLNSVINILARFPWASYGI